MEPEPLRINMNNHFQLPTTDGYVQREALKVYLQDLMYERGTGIVPISAQVTVLVPACSQSKPQDSKRDVSTM